MRKSVLSVILIACLGLTASAFAQERGNSVSSFEGIALEDATIKVAAETGKAVVSIGTEQVIKSPETRYYYSGPNQSPGDEFMKKFFEDFFGQLPRGPQKQMGLGSGVIIDPKGYILTNAHVVDNASKITVTLPDGRQFDGQVKGKDTRSDLAIVKINANNLPVAVLGDSSNLKIGQWVVAIGNPFGFALRNHEPTVTVGVVSALHRALATAIKEGEYNDLIQTDAAINPGNSGGPLTNLKGEVVGINVAIFSTTGGYEGMGFSMPINVAKRIMTQLIEGKKIVYGWIGVTVQDLNEGLAKQFGAPDINGALVVNVMANGPAEKAGLRAGDIIRQIDKKPVKDVEELLSVVERLQVGSKADFAVLRQAKAVNLRVTVAERPESPEAAAVSPAGQQGEWRGVAVDNLNQQYMQQYGIQQKNGVVVIGIEPGSPADDAGLSEGDLILEINREKINNLGDYARITAGVKGDALVRTNRGYFIIKENIGE